MQQKQQCIQDDSTDVEDVVLGNNAGEEEEELESATDGSIEIPGNMAYFQNRYPWLQISAPEKVQEDPPATICSNNFSWKGYAGKNTCPDHIAWRQDLKFSDH